MQLGARQLLLALFIITIFQVSKCSLWPNVTQVILTRESLQDIFSGSCSGSWGITNTRLGIAALGLDALDEPYRLAKPAQQSCFTGRQATYVFFPYLHWSLFGGINVFLKLHLYITFVLILDKKNLLTKVAAMPSSFMNFCRVPDLKKCVKIKFANEISI
jgi:hypothetical protein